MIAVESIFPARCEWDRALDDVSKAPADAVRIRLVSKAKHIDKLPTFPRLKSLWCFDIAAPQLESICRCVSIESLYIDNVKTEDLTGFTRLPQLKVLGLERCSKVYSLADLADLHSLEGLAITHFKNVHDLAPLSRLANLRSLAVAGSMWTTMHVESLEPLEGLTNLEFLHLTNIKPGDGTLNSLGSLAKLKKLDIANFYPTSEFAWLARQLPSTECDWFKPYIEMRSFPCKKCGAMTMVMLSGKGATPICMTCDKPKLEKHLREWNAESKSKER